MCKRLNPFTWTRNTIVAVLVLFLTLTVPPYILGLSAFATTINPVNAHLSIPAIRLSTPVTPVTLDNNKLATPNQHIGSYTNGNKTFLFAHNTTAFKNLSSINAGDPITYTLNDQPPTTYSITRIETLPVADILMSKLLMDTDQPSLILMTCAGPKNPDNTYPLRFIIHATAL